MPTHHPNIFPQSLRGLAWHERRHLHTSTIAAEAATLAPENCYSRFETSPAGLTSTEAAGRLERDGPNALARDQQRGLLKLFAGAVFNPLVMLLLVLSSISVMTGDLRAASVMGLMIGLGVGLKLFQEHRADRAAAQLRAMISVRGTALRDGLPVELPISQLVSGDIVLLSAGDMIPADLKILTACDLFVMQSSLTGESYPVEKFPTEPQPTDKPGLGPVTTPPAAHPDRPNLPPTAKEAAPGVASSAQVGIPNVTELNSIAFLGTSVESGSATAVVIATGEATYLGGMAQSLTAPQEVTAFDRGIARFTWLMLQFVLVMVPLVFLINGLTKGDWSNAFFFAIAVAVGLTPEMLPMIVTVCLSKGALAMSRQKVIVKRINAIQNLGAMDILCTDKTGTLTADRVLLDKYCDVCLRDDAGVLKLAYLNSHFQTGLRNVLDRAILSHTETHQEAQVPNYTKADEIPFDFHRRIMSVIVRTPEGEELLISKGAPEAIYPRCSQFELDGEIHPLERLETEDLRQEYERLSADGFRVLAIASKIVHSSTITTPASPSSPPSSASEPSIPARHYTADDECQLTLHGYLAFLDPPKDSARQAIDALQQHGVQIKVITGDNELVARKICTEVGLATDQILLGSQIELLSDADLAEKATATTLFARVSPVHKQRIIRALQSRQHTVGFLGDGINDAPALRAADVGISVDSAVDIAKESADLILLEKSLLVLETGVVEGRKVFANILKYVRMGASSNFGNMFSVLGASVLVPFLPMAPIQILANNLLYDLSQSAIPTDNVDPEQVERPRPWNLPQLTRFILFIGPCSSLFDYTTYFMMLWVFGCWNVSTPEAAAHSQSLFQTGWFVESLMTQTLIIHIIRTNRIPFLQSIASWPVLAMTAAVLLLAIFIPGSALGSSLGFVPLPALYWPLLLLTLVCYAGVTQWVKTWLLRRAWI